METIGDLKATIAEHNETIEELNAMIEVLVGKIAYLQKENANLKDENANLKEENANLKDENANLKEENAKLKERCDSFRLTNKKWVEEYSMLEAAYSKLQAEREKILFLLMTPEEKKVHLQAKQESEKKKETFMSEFRAQLDKALRKT